MDIQMLVTERERVASTAGDVDGRVPRLYSFTSTSRSVTIGMMGYTDVRKAAVALHPGAMYRLGTAELNGALNLSRRPKEGVKWLKRSAEHATEEFPHALHELALLHERGIEHVVFIDFDYAAELLAQAAELGYAPSAFKLGECYEYGKMGCPQDAALSIHYYVCFRHHHLHPR
jgi:hypothetical protein